MADAPKRGETWISRRFLPSARAWISFSDLCPRFPGYRILRCAGSIRPMCARLSDVAGAREVGPMGRIDDVFGMQKPFFHFIQTVAGGRVPG